MMKKTSFTLLFLLLGACTVPTYDPATITFPPHAMKYQKKGFIGHTNSEQRMQAFIACGLPSDRYNDMLGYIYGAHEGEGWEDVKPRVRVFEQCMAAKGYLFLRDSECGSAKENKGICK